MTKSQTHCTKGNSRVGCFPCMMCKHGEVKNMIDHHPEAIDKLRDWEGMFEGRGSTFFPPNYIPKHAMANRKYPTIDDVVKYIKGRNQTEPIFDEPTGDDRCMSAYHLCE